LPRRAATPPSVEAIGPVIPGPADRCRRHEAQNALARAVCRIENSMDQMVDRPTAVQALEQALDEIERAGELIATL